MGKVSLALIHAAKRIKPYFQGRIVKVYTKYAPRKLLQNSQVLSKPVEWARYLSTYNIIFEPHKVEKGYVMASLLTDFLIEDVKQLKD